MFGIGLGLSMWSGASVGGGAAANSLWLASTGYTLTNGGATAQRTSGTADRLVQGNTFKSSGVATFNIDSLPGGTVMQVGIADSSINFDSFAGGDGHGAIYQNNGTTVYNNVSTGSLPSYTAGDVIIADWSDGVHLIFKKNGSVVATINVSGTLSSAAPIADTALATGGQTSLSGW